MVSVWKRHLWQKHQGKIYHTEQLLILHHRTELVESILLYLHDQTYKIFIFQLGSIRHRRKKEVNPTAQVHRLGNAQAHKFCFRFSYPISPEWICLGVPLSYLLQYCIVSISAKLKVKVTLVGPFTALSPRDLSDLVLSASVTLTSFDVLHPCDTCHLRNVPIAAIQNAGFNCLIIERLCLDFASLKSTLNFSPPNLSLPVNFVLLSLSLKVCSTLFSKTYVNHLISNFFFLVSVDYKPYKGRNHSCNHVIYASWLGTASCT